MKGPCLADQMPHLVPGSRRCFEVLFLFVFCAGLRTLGAVDDRGRSLLNVEAAVVDKNGADYGISPHRDGIHYASAVAMLQDGAAPDSSRRGLLSLKDSSVSDEGPDSSTTTTTVVGDLTALAGIYYRRSRNHSCSINLHTTECHPAIHHDACTK